MCKEAALTQTTLVEHVYILENNEYQSCFICVDLLLFQNIKCQRKRQKNVKIVCYQ